MRPRRLYYDQDKDKYYYIVKSKKKYIKKPEGISQKQLVRINIKNIVGTDRPKRVKKRKIKKQIKLQKKIVPELSRALVNEGGLPVYLYREGKKFVSLDDIVKNKDKDDIKLLINQFKVPNQVEKEDITTKNSTPILTRESSVKSVLQKSRDIIEKTKVRLSPVSTPTLSREISSKERPTKAMILNFLTAFVKSGLDQNIENFRIFVNTNFPEYDLTLNSDYKNIYNENIVKANNLFGSGDTTTKSHKVKDGLYNDEIEKILKAKLKDFIPVVASDEVNDLMRYVKPGMKRFGFIINTSDSTSDGSGSDGKPVGHWYSCYINNEDDFPSIEIFDPLVNEPSPTLISGLRKIAKVMNPENMFKLKINYLQRQSKNMGTCGYHAIKFLDDRFNGVSFSEASGYDNYIEKNKPDHSVDGENDLKNKIKKYNMYL
jgi:hypothetical protein